MNLTRAGRPKVMAGQPPKCANFPLLFGIALFHPLHHSVCEDFSHLVLKITPSER
jgi:hypothetical protein